MGAEIRRRIGRLAQPQRTGALADALRAAEKDLERIAAGKGSVDVFLEGIENFVRDTVREFLESEVSAWTRARNTTATTVDWQFTTDDARIKLKRLYPVITTPEEALLPLGTAVTLPPTEAQVKSKAKPLRHKSPPVPKAVRNLRRDASRLIVHDLIM